jgi:phage terminase small subunit
MTADGTSAELIPRHRRFVEEYVRDFNGTQAAIRVGYSERSAHVTASRLLSNAKVQQALSEKQQAITASAAWDVERWLDVVGGIAEHGESEAARVSAAALLAKYLGISEKHDHRVVHAQLPEGLTLEELRRLAGVDPDWPTLNPDGGHSA